MAIRCDDIDLPQTTSGATGLDVGLGLSRLENTSSSDPLSPPVKEPVASGELGAEVNLKSEGTETEASLQRTPSGAENTFCLRKTWAKKSM